MAGGRASVSPGAPGRAAGARGEPGAPLPAPPVGAPTLAWVPAPVLFVTGAVTQYVGSGLAVLLFAVVPVPGVTWLRVVAGAAVLLAWRRPWQASWTRGTLILAAAFGCVLAAMNLTFYEAIDRLPLGTTVAIEFCGPVAVAALGSRGRRDAAALALAAAGVALLADVHIAGSPLGVALALVAGGCWAGYVVLGHRVSTARGLRAQDGLAFGMACGALALTPVGLLDGAAQAVAVPWRLAAGLGVGVLSSAVPYALEQVAMRRLPRARFALLLALLPATAAVVGAVVLGQVPALLELVGIGLVCGAAGLRSHQGPPRVSAGEGPVP